MTEWVQDNTVIVGLLIAVVTVAVPALVALFVARKTQPSAEAQEKKLEAETTKILAEVNDMVQEQLRDQLADQQAIISKLEERVAALEDALASERVERQRLETELESECILRKQLETELDEHKVRLDAVYQWAKALEAQVIELGATPIPFSNFVA